MDIKLVSTLLLLQFMAVVSPGPDLLLTLRNSVNFGMRAGILSSLGFGTGILVHSMLALLAIKGLGQIPQELLPLLGLPGSLYLIYLGIKSWPASAASELAPDLTAASRQNSYQEGFITNLFNPKACLFTIGLIATQVRPDTDQLTLLVLVSGIVAITVLWFSLVSIALAHQKIRDFYFHQSRKINYIFSVFFILFGLLLIKDLLDLLLSNLS